MNKHQKLPSAIVLMILTLITILFSISSNIYRNYTAKKPSIVSDEIMLPLNPKLDLDTMNEIEKREFLQQLQQ